MSYLDERRKYIEAGRPLKVKEKKPIAKKSAKRIEKEKQEAENRAEGDSDLQKWFKARMKHMTGRCNECGLHTETRIYRYAINSICHILAKRDAVAPSVKYHPLNWIELCEHHHNILDKSNWKEIEQWGCWETIRDRLVMVYPDLAPKERRHFPSAVLKYIEQNNPFAI